MYMEGKKRLVGLFEPTYKRVRTSLGGEIIADSTRVMILRESPIKIVYYFPKADVSMEHLTLTDHVEDDETYGERIHWTISAGGSKAENAAYSYHEQEKGNPDLRDYIAFEFDAMDAWHEEDEEILGHPRDPYHRVDIRHSRRDVRVEVAGETVAQTDHALFVFETSLDTRYYIPSDDVNMDYLKATDTESRCPYKGLASYWSVIVDGETYSDYAWAYDDPEPDNERLRGLVCFYDDKPEVTVFVDGVAIEEQAQVEGGH